MRSVEHRVEVDGVGRAEWSALLARFEDATVIQSWDFPAALSAGGRVSRVVVRRGDEAVALAQVRVVELPVIRRGVAHVSWGPVWRRRGTPPDLDALAAALAALRDEYAVRRKLLLRVVPKVTTAEGSGAVDALSSLGFRREERAKPYETLLLDIAPSQEEILARADRSWRKAFRKAERNGVTIREGTSPSLFRELVPLYGELVALKGFRREIDVEGWARFQEIAPEPERSAVFLADHGGRTVAGLAVSCVGATGLGIGIGGGRAARDLLASYLLHWRAIRWMKAAGCSAYDLVGSKPVENPGPYLFKKALGAEDRSFIGTFVSCRSATSRLVVGVGEPLRATLRGLASRLRPAPPARAPAPGEGAAAQEAMRRSGLRTIQRSCS
jgi:hypothetical protein